MFYPQENPDINIELEIQGWNWNNDVGELLQISMNVRKKLN